MENPRMYRSDKSYFTRAVRQFESLSSPVLYASVLRFAPVSTARDSALDALRHRFRVVR